MFRAYTFANGHDQPLTRRFQGFALVLALVAASVASSADIKKFEGVSIIIGTQNVEAIGSPAKAHASTWQERTGATAEVVQSDFSDLFDNYYSALKAEQPGYDVLLFPSAWAADFYPYLAELPEPLRDSESFDDIHPIYRDRLMTWNGKWIAVTVDGDLFNGYYRKDLFKNPLTRASFRNQYGYELFPPDTWQQYQDIAEFFNGTKQADGSTLYGTSEAFARNGQQIWTVFSRASAYTNHPEHPGAQFFDPDTMRAQIDNPGWLRTIKEYKQILQFAPPGALDFDIVEARQAFLTGQTAMSLDWGDTAQLASDPAYSKVSDNVGYFVLPGTRQTWNGRRWQWHETGSVHKAPFLAFGGWVAGVPRNSRNPQAAWDYIMWYSSPENSLRDAVTSGTGINPYRFTHFTNIDAWTQALSKTAASEYLGVVRNSLDSPNVATDLRIKGFYRYTQAFEKELCNILHENQPIDEAMSRVARAWEDITDDLGRDKQLADYRAAMNLSAAPDGPRPGSPSGRKNYIIGFSQATTTEPWRLLFNKELRAEAALHSNVELQVRDAKDSISTQIDHMESFISAGVDAILISPKVEEALTPAVSKAFVAGIPVFVLDRDVANDRYTQYIGGDNKEIGRAAGRQAVKLLGGKGRAKGKIVEIWGGRASTPAQDRHLGFSEIVTAEPGVEIYHSDQDSDWKQDLAYGHMTDALEAHSDIDLVYAHNDPMAYGAYLAAEDVNRADDILFLGIDGIPAEGVRWVRDGVLDATFVYKTPGDEAIRQALHFLNGQPVVRRLTLPTMLVDQSNAQRILEQNGID